MMTDQEMANNQLTALLKAIEIMTGIHYGRRIDELEQQNTALVAVLEDGCEFHHIPLVNGWAHKTELGILVRCRLSEKAREALALALAEATKQENK